MTDSLGNVTVLTYEDPASGTVEIQPAPDAAIAMIAQMIAELDGTTRTLVTVSGRGDSHVAVGGDATSGLVVYATFDNQTFYTLLNPAADPQETVEVVAGGQPARYPAHKVVPLDIATHAAIAFAQDGRLAEDCYWDT